MTPATFATLVRLYTKTNSTTLPNADLQALTNPVKDDISMEIVKRHSSMFTIRATDNLVADQRIYSYPSNVLNHLIKLECSFATATPLAYVPVDPINERGLGFALTEAQITNHFSNNVPRYLRRGRTLHVLSGTIIAVTSGIRLTYRLWPADITDFTSSTDMDLDPSTTTFGFPREFHELMARGVSIAWKQQRPKPMPLSALEQNYKVDLESKLAGVSMEDMGEYIVAARPVNKGYNY